MNDLYPRELTEKEKLLLFSILPLNKAGYSEYRDKINSLIITGSGRFGDGNYILGQSDSVPDLSFPSAPVFALGTLILDGEEEVDVIIHYEEENEIEFELGRDVNEEQGRLIRQNKNYSEWNPGKKSPFTNTRVREVSIKPGQYLLAISADEKKIWLHDCTTGVNHLIPLSNYYNSLMLYINERNSAKVLNPTIFFDNLETYTDIELGSAFVLYNKYMRRKLLEE